jgi:dolichol-phosphate mannosyltransferase
MERSTSTGVAAALARTRAGRALRRSHNWIQLAKFAAVGASGYVVNLAVFATLVRGFEVDHRIAAICSFVVAVANNYTWNRLWTFRDSRGHAAIQGMHFFGVAVVALVANLVVLEVLVALGLDEVLAQAIAIVLVTPINFVGNKLWTFRRGL